MRFMKLTAALFENVRLKTGEPEIHDTEVCLCAFFYWGPNYSGFDMVIKCTGCVAVLMTAADSEPLSTYPSFP